METSATLHNQIRITVRDQGVDQRCGLRHRENSIKATKVTFGDGLRLLVVHYAKSVLVYMAVRVNAFGPARRKSPTLKVVTTYLGRSMLQEHFKLTLGER